MRNPKKLGWLAGGGAAGAAGRSRCWGLRSPQWGQWVRQCGLGCRAGLSVVAAGVRRGDMRWLAVGGTCGRTAAWGDAGWWRAHAGGSVCGACGARVCCASVVLGGRCVDVVGVPFCHVTG